MKKHMILCLLASLSFLASAQQPENDDTDSVWVEGFITDALSGLPQPHCDVQLLQEGWNGVSALSDSTGFYSLGLVPVGTYTLSVVSSGRSLYYTELQLSQSVAVNIALMPDTMTSHILHAAEVTASRIPPVYHPIKSPDDPRLWNLHANPILGDSGPASKDFSGGHFLFGREVNSFFKPGSLASWRPAWLDAPFPKPAAKPKTEEGKKGEK